MPPDVGGYVLAGGRSSRMGRDKALLELVGRPLVSRAVLKLERVSRDVRILSSNDALGEFAPVVPDLHPGCGPLGGIEAALADSAHDWNLILPVDVPFLPTAFLDWWVRMVSAQEGLRLGMFRVDEVPQPALLMIHREIGPYVSASLGRGEYKLMPALRACAEALAAKRGVFCGAVFQSLPVDEHLQFEGTAWAKITEAQRANQSRWFANLNTPEDFDEAELRVDALDA